MNITVKPMTAGELAELKSNTVKNTLPQAIVMMLENEGWKIDDYSMEKKYKGYFLVIEFCIGDYCSSICSKKGHWLLEKKIPNVTFLDAIHSVNNYIARIDNDEHWTGENN